MLEMRADCERCSRGLPADSADAFIQGGHETVVATSILTGLTAAGLCYVLIDAGSTDGYSDIYTDIYGDSDETPAEEATSYSSSYASSYA